VQRAQTNRRPEATNSCDTIASALATIYSQFY
jgi:hypothetical protein